MSRRREILRVSDLCKHNNGKIGLDHFQLSLHEGESLGIIGLHDSGKSLLLNILNGDEAWDSGSIFYNEQPVDRRLLENNHRIQLINGSLMLNPMLSVLENIFIVRMHKHPNPFIPWKKLHRQLEQCFSELDIELGTNQIVGNLTLAERHLVAIVKAYTLGAKVIMVEHIMSQYTFQEHLAFSRLLTKLKAKGVSFLITGYQLSSLKDDSDHILFLVNGRAAKVVRNFKLSAITVDENRILLGQGVPRDQPRRAILDGVLFEAVDVSTRPGEQISFQVSKGEIAVILDFPHATNGNIISALLGTKAHDGAFLLDGETLNRHVLKRSVCIADYAMGDVVVSSLNLKDNICLSAFPRISTLGFVSRRQRSRITQDFLDLYASLDRRFAFNIEHLSQPEAMAIYLYRILIQRWRLLICTNPEMLFSYETMETIKIQLRQMTETGRAVCIFASTIEPYIDLADCFYLVENGHVQGKFTHEQLNAYLGRNT